MTAQRSSEASSVIDSVRRTSRRCGDCQLCCKLIPVEELGKRASERCRHQRAGKGCAIYAQRPISCALWNCRWLVDKAASCLPRPDRAHYVLDMMPDFVTLSEEGGTPTNIPVVQVWTDPAFPDAHRAPSFRRWLDRQGIFALIRYGSRDGFLLAPPSVTGSSWQEKQSNAAPGLPHSLEDVARVLGEGSEEKVVLDVVADVEPIER